MASPPLLIKPKLTDVLTISDISGKGKLSIKIQDAILKLSSLIPSNIEGPDDIYDYSGIYISMLGVIGSSPLTESSYTDWYESSGGWNDSDATNKFILLTNFFINDNIINYPYVQIVAYYILGKYFSSNLYSCSLDTGDTVYTCTVLTGINSSPMNYDSNIKTSNLPGNIFNWAKNTQGSCDFFLTYFSKTLNATRHLASVYPWYAQWLGCYTQDNLIEGKPKECDPLCQNIYTIPLYDITNSITKKCNESICVIDNASVGIFNSNGGGTFQQVCPSCAGDAGADSNCLCVLDVSTLSGNLEKISTGNGNLSNPLVFQQVCPGAVCITRNSDGVMETTECSTNPAVIASSGKAYLKGSDYFIFFLFAILVFVVLMAAITGSNYNKYTVKFRSMD